jgi:hypothetical protein
MKTKLLLFFAFTLLLAFSSKAQDQTVPVGITKNYSAVGVAAGNTYLWTVTNASGANITSSSLATTDIKWLKPGEYTLKFTETNPLSTSCLVEITKTIRVTGNTLTMGTAPVSNCAPSTGNSTVTFVVNRAGGENIVTVNYSYTINSGTPTTGSVSVLALTNSANIVLTIPNPTDGTTDNVVEVTITSATDADGNTISVAGLTQQTTLFATPITTDISFN